MCNNMRMKRVFGSAWLPRLVLAWFVAFVGVSVASPLVHPVSIQVVCSANGAGKLVETDGSSNGEVNLEPGMHCVLCLPLSAAFPAPATPDLHLSELRYLLREPKPTQLASAEALAPLSRGPPTHS
jgi:hypothetical protein